MFSLSEALFPLWESPLRMGGICLDMLELPLAGSPGVDKETAQPGPRGDLTASS